MLTLTRAVRIREDVALPNGEQIAIDLNVEARLSELLKRFAVASAAAKALQQENAATTLSSFYKVYADFLKVVLGAENWERFRDAFDANLEEICEAMSEWVNTTVVPAMAEASRRNMNRKKRVLK